MASLSIGSTTLAFYLQTRAQARLSATVSSIIFLLESPFALIFAFLLLGESLSFMEASGALLIFISALLVTIRESRRT
jgi:drug/metabolite transporter (DMT)-like permease